MPPSRRARPLEDQQIYIDKTDSENEQGTPVPRRQGLKKRLSEAYNVEFDASFHSESGRPPLRSVNINDDAAEKRRRRKSAKVMVVETAMAGPSSDGNVVSDPPEASKTAKQKQPLRSVDAAPEIAVSLDIMSSNFEEWMKMATDNKINAANSWNFALIDYFHDMSLLRNNDDNSINFQRASCTLDGCVKIWTSRVDSVGTETGKLLSNLASEGKEDDGDEGEGDVGKKKSRGPAATLAKDAAQLQSKKLELEFSVDPLFRKTCADFDEGGAQGLLMNHLSLGLGTEGGMRVVFDAGDSMGRVDEEEAIEEPEDPIDLSFLRSEYLPDLIALEDKAISHSLAGFSFSKDAFSFDGAALPRGHTQQDDDGDFDDGEGNGVDMDGTDVETNNVPAEDFFVGADAVNEDYGGDMMGGDDYGGDNNSTGSTTPPMGGGQPGPLVPFDPRRAPNERDLIMAMTDADGDGMMDYFDQNFLKNWAGPEHWKLKKVVRRPEVGASAGDKPKARREKKEAFKIDFLAPIDADKSLKDIQKELFVQVTKGVGINLPGTGAAAKRGRKKVKQKTRRDDHRLPDDMHFSSKQLVTLFLKPKFYLKMRGQRARLNTNGDGEVDENFWAQAANEAAERTNDRDIDDTLNGGAVPFNTQFFHDDYDDGPGFDDVYDGDGAGLPDGDAGEQDLLAATQGQTRRVRPELVNYAKRAKRVDVRKLKENIWKGLDIVVVSKESDEDERMETDDSLPPPTDPEEGRAFAQVISGLQRSYPREKMEEISTSFCFICLLHLANEQGLKLEATSDSSPGEQEDQEIEERKERNKIGNIWDLKIYRDPNATQSA